MDESELDGQDSNESLAEKRAKWEHLRLAPCLGVGKVNVENVSYGVQAKKDHTYTVSVESGIPFSCTCSDWTYNNPENGCKHMIAVSNAPDVMDKAQPDVATDGGHETDDRFRLPEDPKHVAEDDVARDVSPCPGCGNLTTGDTYGKEQCEGTDEIDTTPL